MPAPRMRYMVMSYWPSLLLSLVLLAGIVACLKRLDYLVVEEVRALISILFGFATSCLLLSFIWLMQRKPLNQTWPQHRHISVESDLPNMNPRGRANSSYSYDSEHLMISTIASGSELDVPPPYEDALVNSKPVHCQHDKTLRSHDKANPLMSDCASHHSPTSHRQVKLSVIPDCDHCLAWNNRLPEDVGWTCKTLEHQSSSLQTRNEPDTGRKFSFVQLDVSQLTLSSSPPKYHDLHLADEASASTVDKSILSMP